MNNQSIQDTEQLALTKSGMDELRQIYLQENHLKSYQLFPRVLTGRVLCISDESLRESAAAIALSVHWSKSTWPTGMSLLPSETKIFARNPLSIDSMSSVALSYFLKKQPQPQNDFQFSWSSSWYLLITSTRPPRVPTGQGNKPTNPR